MALVAPKLSSVWQRFGLTCSSCRKFICGAVECERCVDPVVCFFLFDLILHVFYIMSWEHSRSYTETKHYGFLRGLHA